MFYRRKQAFCIKTAFIFCIKKPRLRENFAPSRLNFPRLFSNKVLFCLYRPGFRAMNISVLSKCFVKIFRIFALRLGQKSCFCVFVKEKSFFSIKNVEKQQKDRFLVGAVFSTEKPQIPLKIVFQRRENLEKQQKKHFFEKKVGKVLEVQKKAVPLHSQSSPRGLLIARKAWSLRLSVRT